jgi:hypothetical protein
MKIDNGNKWIPKKFLAVFFRIFRLMAVILYGIKLLKRHHHIIFKKPSEFYKIYLDLPFRTPCNIVQCDYKKNVSWETIDLNDIYHTYYQLRDLTIFYQWTKNDGTDFKKMK